VLTLAFDFPGSPTLNQTFVDPTTGVTYQWDGIAWRGGPSTVAAAGVSVGDTPPGVPAVGSLWWESDTGKLYIYFDDGSSKQWVQVNYAVSTASGGGGGGSAAATSFAPAGNVAATNVQAAIVELDSEKVAKAGDTMGPLVVTVNAGATEFVIDDTAAATAVNAGLMGWKRSGSPRWRIFLDQADSGNGSHLKYARYDLSGNFVENALTLNRADGTMSVARDLGVGQALVVSGIANITGKLTLTNDAPSKPTAGGFVATSDERVKRGIKDYTAGLEAILELRPVTFRFRPDTGYDSDTVHVGMVAQEVENILPECVTSEPGRLGKIELDDLRSFDPTNITYALVNAVKALKAEIDALRAQWEAR